MFYAGDEYADDDCTSGPLAWTDQFALYADDDAEDDDVPFDPFDHLAVHALLDGIESQ